MINVGYIILFLSGEVRKGYPPVLPDFDTDVPGKTFDCAARPVESGWEFRIPISENNLRKAKNYLKKRGYLVKLELRSFSGMFPLKEQKAWFDKDLVAYRKEIIEKAELEKIEKEQFEEEQELFEEENLQKALLENTGSAKW